MIFSYEDFVARLSERVKDSKELYYELLVTVVKFPGRYTGIFRLSNARTKLLQNLTQSREIKFGDFMEDIVTDYIAAMGYANLDKNIGTDEEGNPLSADQVFTAQNAVCLIEQKIRDDHDSTKKRGQYDNFQKKYALLARRYPERSVRAVMWFIDDSFSKNRSYYIDRARQETLPGVRVEVLYGGQLFARLFGRTDVWDELCGYLRRNKLERSDEVLRIPDFDTSPEMAEALARLRAEEPGLYRRLRAAPAYAQLRAELFPTGENLRQA